MLDNCWYNSSNEGLEADFLWYGLGLNLVLVVSVSCFFKLFSKQEIFDIFVT